MVNKTLNPGRFFAVLLLGAAVMTSSARLRGAEYDEQYSLFLTAGTARPDWPETAFPAGLVRELQTGRGSLAAIGEDLRRTDVHPPLYFWLLSLWRAVLGPSLFAARLFSVAAGLGALALTGAIAARTGVPAARAMMLTLGCYAFTYTSGIARGFALAQMLLLAGVFCLLPPLRPAPDKRRHARFALGGLSLGAASFTNYLAVFVALACLAAIWARALSRRGLPDGTGLGPAISVLAGFAAFVPADLWWFAAQRGSRVGQFPSFSLIDSLARLTERMGGALLGGLPLYVEEPWRLLISAGLGLLLLTAAWRVARGWNTAGWGAAGSEPPIATHARGMLFLGALAPPAGLLLLGALFNNSPIEIRYLTFATPFAALLLASASGPRLLAAIMAAQAAAIAGLLFAPQTMQPAQAVARAASAWAATSRADEGIVLVPYGNDGVGVVGGFANEASPGTILLTIRQGEAPSAIHVRIEGFRRVFLALLEQDDASRAAVQAMRRAFMPPPPGTARPEGVGTGLAIPMENTVPTWRVVSHGSGFAVYERGGGGK